MTPDEIDKLTIADVRAINERAEQALSTLRALGLMGGAATASTSQASSNAVVVSPTPGTRVRTPLAPGELEDMAAQREALVARNRDLPPEILAAERTAPP